MDTDFPKILLKRAAKGDIEELSLENMPVMVLVPAGTFTLGSSEKEITKIAQLIEHEKTGFDADKLFREIEEHEIYLEEYAIGEGPVSNFEYALFLIATNYTPPKNWGASWPVYSLQNHPIVNVSWMDAVAYCNWLSEISGKKYRLPTEPEWEKAARGTDKRKYPWGDKWDAGACNNRLLKLMSTTAIGQFSPTGDSPYGCRDMVGNVWEWTGSRYGGTEKIGFFKYPYIANDGREDLTIQDSRVSRGGSFHNGPLVARCSYRGGRSSMSHVSDHKGFRCVCELS